MDYQRKTLNHNPDNQKLEQMYENLTNISKQLAVLQGFMENKFGSEFTVYCQQTKTFATLEGTYACPEGGPVNEDGEEYDKMPNLVSQESPSRTLGYVSVPLRQPSSEQSPRSISSSSTPGEMGLSSIKVQIDSSKSSIPIKCEPLNNSGNGKDSNNTSSSEDLMYPLHNFTDLLVENASDEVDVQVHGSSEGNTAATTPEFMEMELDPSQLLRGEPPILHPIFSDNNQAHSNSQVLTCNSNPTGATLLHNHLQQHNHGQSHTKRSSGSRGSTNTSGSSYSKYDMIGINNETNFGNMCSSGNSHLRANNQRRASVENNIQQSHHSSQKKSFSCLICGIQFEYPETLKSHMDSHGSCRNIRSNSGEQSGMEENSEEPQPPPRLLPRPTPSQVSISMSYQNPTIKSTRSKKSRQATSGSSSSSSSSNTESTTRRKTYNQSRPCSLECPECGLKIRDKSRLIEHLRGHTGERPFLCTYCDKTYTRKDVLKTHILKMHGELPSQYSASSLNELVQNSSSSIAEQKANEVTSCNF